MARAGLRLLVITCCVFGVVHTLFLAFQLLVPDLNLGYPFVGGDSFDWISQALHFAGYEVRYPGRPPLFPLVMAGLEVMSALHLTPLLLQLLIAITTVVLFRVVAVQYSSSIALAVSIAFFVNYSWRSLGLEIMADVPAACLILLSLVAFSKALTRPRFYVLAGLFAGLSAITQPISLLMLLPMSGAVFLHRRRDLRTRLPWIGLTLFVLPSLLWMPIRLLWIGSAGSGPLHWQLLGLHLHTVPFYLWAGIAFVGLPGFFLGAWGLWVVVPRIGRDPWALVLVTALLLFLGFFSLAYGFAAKRFLVYSFVLAPFLWAEGLSRLQRVKPMVVVSLLLIVWSWMPYPDRGSSSLRLALLPVPATYLVASSDQWPRGDVRPDLSDVKLEQPGRLLWSSVMARAWTAGRRVVRPAAVDLLASDRSAVFLSRSEAENSRRYLTVTRLGNALRRRVKFVSKEQLQPYIDSLPLSRVGRILDWQVFRTGLPGIHGNSLMVLSSDEITDLDGSVDLAHENSSSINPIIRTAQGLVADLPANDDVVAVITKPGTNDQLLTYLAFLAPSSNFYIIDSEDPAETLNDLGCDNPVLLEPASNIVVDGCTILGYQATVVRLLK